MVVRKECTDVYWNSNHQLPCDGLLHALNQSPSNIFIKVTFKKRANCKDCFLIKWSLTHEVLTPVHELNDLYTHHLILTCNIKEMGAVSSPVHSTGIPHFMTVSVSLVNCSQSENFYIKDPIPVNLNGKNYNWFINPQKPSIYNQIKTKHKIITETKTTWPKHFLLVFRINSSYVIIGVKYHTIPNKLLFGSCWYQYLY